MGEKCFRNLTLQSLQENADLHLHLIYAEEIDQRTDLKEAEAEDRNPKLLSIMQIWSNQNIVFVRLFKLPYKAKLQGGNICGFAVVHSTTNVLP